MRNNLSDRNEKSLLYRVVKITDRAVSFISGLLILVILMYSSYMLWYSSSLKRGSFISDELAQYRPDSDGPAV